MLCERSTRVAGRPTAKRPLYAEYPFGSAFGKSCTTGVPILILLVKYAAAGFEATCRESSK